MMGTQSGSVMPVTSTEPGWKRSISRGLFITTTLPEEMPSPIASPVTSRFPVSRSR